MADYVGRSSSMRIRTAIVAALSGAAFAGCGAPTQRAPAERQRVPEISLSTTSAADSPDVDLPASPAACLAFADSGVEKPSDPSDLLFYVNRRNAIPAQYPVSATSIWSPCSAERAPGDARDLVCIPSAYSYRNREALRSIAFEDELPTGVTSTFDGLSAGHRGKLGFRALIDAARAEAGFDLYVRSGFRAYSMQSATFHGWMAQEMAKGRNRNDAEIRVRSYSALAGHSEHQLGTTADLVYRAPNGVVYDGWDAEQIADSAPMRWVADNAHRFGLVLTYDRDHTDITQYVWEPWHYRYVGFDVANELRRCGLSTEEYLQARYHVTPVAAQDAARRSRSAHR